ncbi:MAG: hypothetical protein HQ570_02755 [Candidatus Omnitrophica bacterium]|nr:hypothetical protein [Candidatus Omnitrophota bacterium]
MFKNLLRFWKGEDFLKYVLESFKNMLDDAEEMFNAVCKKLIHGQGEPNLRDKIYNIDKKINGLQKDIRRRVIEHLSLQPAVDAPTCLILMSVVKDAERLGDYSKNLFEVSNLFNRPLNEENYLRLFDGIEEKITVLFKQTKKAFIESDEDEAESSWVHEKEILKRCEEIISKVATSEISTNEAVCFVLMARYFKRIAAHLANIATSVILPVTDLDYFDERKSDG